MISCCPALHSFDKILKFAPKNVEIPWALASKLSFMKFRWRADRSILNAQVVALKNQPPAVLSTFLITGGQRRSYSCAFGSATTERLTSVIPSHTSTWLCVKRQFGLTSGLGALSQISGFSTAVWQRWQTAFSAVLVKPSSFLCSSASTRKRQGGTVALAPSMPTRLKRRCGVFPSQLAASACVARDSKPPYVLWSHQTRTPHLMHF